MNEFVSRARGRYATVSRLDGSADFRTIANIMTERGHPMNHATARNITVRAIESIVREIIDAHGYEADEEYITKVATSPEFQEGLGELLQELHA